MVCRQLTSTALVVVVVVVVLAVVVVVGMGAKVMKGMAEGSGEGLPEG